MPSRRWDKVKLNKFIKLVKKIMQINYSGVKIDQRIEPVSQYERSGISLLSSSKHCCEFAE